MKKKWKAGRMAVLSAALCAGIGLEARILPSEPHLIRAQETTSVSALLDCAAELVQTDPVSNAAAIEILLNEAIANLEEDLAGVQMLKSALALLQSKSPDKTSLLTLIQSAQTLLQAENTTASQETASSENTGMSEERTETQKDTAVPDTEITEPQEDTSVPDTKITEPQENTSLPDTENMGTQESAETSQNSADETEETDETDETEDAEETDETETEYQREPSSLPAYNPQGYIWKLLTQEVSLQVPSGWGDNASERAFTSYSPVNASGAISPEAGTLSTTYFSLETLDGADSFEEYEQSIAKMNVTSDVTSEETLAAGLPARRIRYLMTIGANQFSCELVCFNYGGNMYAVELMQGSKSSYDYFQVFDNAVSTLQTGDEVQSESETVAEIELQSEKSETAAQTESKTSEEGETAAQTESETSEESGTERQAEAQTEPQTAGQRADTPQEEDLGSFCYAMNGVTYQFPTQVKDLAPDALPLDWNQELPYDLIPDQDTNGLWNELSNTEYYFFENALYKEMAGITNLSGQAAPITEGVLTALIDMEGSSVSVTLPGGLTVGSPESAIAAAFPEFAGRALDGIAAFRGSELLYACNVRDDGCNGYVLIRNDAPYYSTLSIICEQGVVREICFECLGQTRADGIFL